MPLIQKYNFSMTDSVRSAFHHSRYRKAVHIHQFAEIVFVLDGSFRVTANGKKAIAKAGDMIIVPPYQPHGFYTENGKEVNIWMMLFPGNLISDISMSAYMHHEYESAIFTPCDALSSFVRSKFFDTGEKLVELDNSGIRKMKALLYPIFEEYISSVPTVLASGNRDNSVTAAVMGYLSKNFYKSEPLSAIASAIGYSESYISHNLKKTINLSLSNLRNSYRVDYAKNLLTNGDMSTFRVGLECGFNCQRSFDRAFKKQTGITPQRYKEIHSSPSKKAK